MPGPPTPNLGLTVPTVGGDANAWGGELNADLAILDGLGVATVSNQNSNFNAAASTIFPEIIYRVTTGAGNVTATLPSAASCAGKFITLKKIDAGVGQLIVSAGAGTIDGSATYTRALQYQYVRLFSNGTTYDIVANN